MRRSGKETKRRRKIRGTKGKAMTEWGSTSRQKERREVGGSYECCSSVQSSMCSIGKGLQYTPHFCCSHPSKLNLNTSGTLLSPQTLSFSIGPFLPIASPLSRNSSFLPIASPLSRNSSHPILPSTSSNPRLLLVLGPRSKASVQLKSQHSCSGSQKTRKEGGTRRKKGKR